MSSILVLDDRAENRELMATVLRFGGYSVTLAGSGDEALALARVQAPDLVIADILMPEMDGYEFVRELRRDPALHDVRVMFCTATYADAEVRRLAAACGVSHILFKPCEPDEILEAVAAALDSAVDPVMEFAPEDMRQHLRLLNGKLIEKIEQLEEAQREAAESLTLLETLLSTAPIGFGFVDRDFRLRRINETLAAVNGVPVSEHLGRTVAEVVPEIWPSVEPAYRHVLDTGEAIVNQDVGAPAGGQLASWLLNLYPVRIGTEVIGIGIMLIDITERHQAETLRSAVMENLAEGVVVSDLEGRLVYMNSAGSQMLGWSEEELRGEVVHPIVHFQHADGSPCNMEHCEFVTVRTQGRKIRKTDDALTRKDGTIFPAAWSGAPLRSGDVVTGSVIIFRDTTEEKAEQVRAQRELDALTWVGRTRDALEDDRLVLYSQPIVSLTGGQGSEELLIRMVGRDGEIVAPGSFLPVAEKYGLVGEIDRWVISQAIALAGTGRHVEANLSARSVSDLGLLRIIERDFHSTGVDPSLVVFEITETALMQNMEAGEAFVTGLAEIGAGVALDDFGTGFGSFTYLQRLPLQFLKIDIAFVRDLTSNSANRHLIKAIVGLARDFGYRTIAEGVEDGQTLDLLKELGVDMAQGYYLGRPAPIAQGSPSTSTR